MTLVIIMLEIVMIEYHAQDREDEILNEPLDTFRGDDSSPTSSSLDRYLYMEDDNVHLGIWEKLGLMAIGTAVVCMTLCVVVCTVGPGCCIYNWIRKIIVQDSSTYYVLHFMI